MKTRPYTLAVILPVVLALLSCGGPAAQREAAFDEDVVAREIKAAREALDAAIVSEDVGGYLAHYMEDAVWIPPHAEEFIGRSAAAQKLESFFATVNVEGDSEIEEQLVFGANWAGERGRFSILLAPKEGDAEPIHEVGSYLSIWTKDTDGKWKIACDIWNSDRAMPALPGSQGKQ